MEGARFKYEFLNGRVRYVVDENGVARRIERGKARPHRVAALRAAADGALRALRQTAPFDVPQGFPGGVYRPTFNTERACRNR